MVKQYAIKVELAPNDWIYVTKSDSKHCWDLVPETYKSKTDAEKAADTWRKKSTRNNVKVVNYES